MRLSALPWGMIWEKFSDVGPNCTVFHRSSVSESRINSNHPLVCKPHRFTKECATFQKLTGLFFTLADFFIGTFKASRKLMIRKSLLQSIGEHLWNSIKTEAPIRACAVSPRTLENILTRCTSAETRPFLALDIEGFLSFIFRIAALRFGAHNEFAVCALISELASIHTPWQPR